MGITEKSAAETNGTDGAKGEVNATYNLIILDESGSMNGVREQTVSGCNETLNGIRSAAKENTEIKQYVSIYCFDSSHPRYLFKNAPIEEVRDLTYEDYCPNACTPLYDAVGYTVTELKKALESTPDTGKVTIITDGMENARGGTDSQSEETGMAVHLHWSQHRRGGHRKRTRYKQLPAL